MCERFLCGQARETEMKNCPGDLSNVRGDGIQLRLVMIRVGNGGCLSSSLPMTWFGGLGPRGHSSTL